MKMRQLCRSAFVCLSAVSLLACNRDPEPDPNSAWMIGGSPPASIAPEKTTYTQVGPGEDISYATVRRYSSRIIVPPGRSRLEVRATLERAARALADSTHAHAVMVLAYRQGDDPDGIFSAGRAVYSPNGRWEDADTGGMMAMTMELAELYFAPPDTSGAPGDTVVLAESAFPRVSVSEDFGNTNIIARVPNGTRAVILERRSHPIIDQELVRYRVRTLGPGTRHTGWVHKFNTQP